MDYDHTAMPANYDAGRSISTATGRERLAFFTQEIDRKTVERVVDLGCGTGRFLSLLGEAFEAEVVGVEPSFKMLERAAEKSLTPGRLVSASAEALPLADESADIIFLSMVFHHIRNLDAFAAECGRVLRRGGAVCIRNTTSDEIESYPYLTYFEGLRDIIAGQLNSRAEIDALFVAAGFGPGERQTHWQELAPDWQSYGEKMALRADSFLTRLPDEAFATGLRALQEHKDPATATQAVGLNVDSLIYRKL